MHALFPINIMKNFSNIRSVGVTRITPKCLEKVKLFQEGLKTNSMWVLQMIDASSKIPSGILMGNQVDLGMYDECMEINSAETGEEIHGRHCMYNVIANLRQIRISETLSICMPASCEAKDVEEIVNNVLDNITSIIGNDVPITIGEATCSSVELPEWTSGGIITLVGFSLLILFLVVCTICDFFMRSLTKEPSPNSILSMLCSFSIYSNALRVLSTKNTPQTLPAIQGLRCLSMCWVLIGHSYSMNFFAPTINLQDIYQWVFDWNSLYIVTAPYAVDSFFTISGFLMSYLFLKEMFTGRHFNVFEYYVHRYLRLTPEFACLVLVAIFILPRIGSGPIWEKYMTTQEDSCSKNWWAMFLYLHNYVNNEPGGCLTHTWYMAVEMQFFYISPLILYPLARKSKLGLVILAAFSIVSVLIPTIIASVNEYSSVSITTNRPEKLLESMEKFYNRSHNRASPWIIGIFFGYLVFTQKRPISKATKWIGWLLTTAAFLFCIFSMRKFQDKEYFYDAVWETFYTAVARPLWGATLGWIIYASVRGFGGPITTILSFSIFTPLSRISYCVYLVHYTIQIMKVAASRSSRYFSNFTAFDSFVSDMMLSIIIGFVYSLIFESPVLVLEKIVKNLGKRKTNDTKKILNDERVENGIDKPVSS